MTTDTSTAKTSAAAATDALTFEQAMSELEAIVRRLEAGQSDLAATIEDYSRGMALKAHCEKRLQEARLRVDAIINGGDGSPSLVPFDIKE